MERTHSIGTTFRCHSAKRVQNVGHNKYIYNLVARNGREEYSPYYFQNVTVTLEKIPGYLNHYRSTYTSEGTQVTHTLLKMHPNGHCSVLYVEKSDGQTGCELIETVSALTPKLQNACRGYFYQHCRGKKLNVFMPGCVYPN
uniref:Lipocalin/cytosolic fatty-acid binding domain-containing protein n=1 Tax=Amblyomma maculatum TaxID=34609 RepID=G3MSF2_AMBMU